MEVTNQRHEERELKLLVGDDLTPLALELLIEEAGLTILSRETREQTDRYYDTKYQDLLRAGVALRTRETAGGATITCKCAGRVDGALHERFELELPWQETVEPERASTLPQALRDQVEPFALASRLRVAMLITTRRHARRVIDPANEESLEVVLDEVHVGRGDAGPHVFREVEIEGNLGSESRGRTLAAVLVARAGAAPSTRNKLERALEACGRAALPEEPVSVLPGGSGAGAAAQALLLGLWHTLQRCEVAVRTTSEVDAVHEFRVACRRARSALRLFADLYKKRQREPVEAYLRQLGKALGRVRDLDVRGEAIRETRPQLQDGEARLLENVLTALCVRRAEELARLRAWLGDEGRLNAADRAQRKLAERPEGRHAEDELVPFLEARVAETAADVFARGAAIEAASPPEDLHELRIAVKRLRYALEFGAFVLPDDLAPVPKQLAKLQKWLGTYNDAITAQLALPDQLPMQGDEDLALAHALALQRRAGQAAKARFFAEYPSIVDAQMRARLGVAEP